MWQAISQFWQDNSTNIVVSLIVGFVFFILGPLGLWFSGKRIRRERIRKAKETLIDLLEGMVVNQAQIDEEKLKSVYQAVERDIDIELAGEYQLNHWLGDVVLRFERSRHLSAEQKQAYYDTVRKISDDVKAREAERPKVAAPRQYAPVIAELKSALAAKDAPQALSAVEELERSLYKRQASQDPLLNVFRIYRRLYERNPLTFLVSVVLVLSGYVYFVMKFLPF